MKHDIQQLTAYLYTSNDYRDLASLTYRDDRAILLYPLCDCMGHAKAEIEQFVLETRIRLTSLMA